MLRSLPKMGSFLRLEAGTTVSIIIISLSSLLGAWIGTLTLTGRASPLAITGVQASLFVGSWLILGAWAVLFARLLRRTTGLSTESCLYWAALCHVPLFWSAALLTTLYQNDTAYHIFAATELGSVLRPLTLLCVISPPLVLQALRLLIADKSSLQGALVFFLVASTAVTLRFNGMWWGLPGRFHPDEYSARAMQMFASNDMNPHFFLNPTLMIYAIYFAQALMRPHISAFHQLATFVGVGVNDPRNDFFLLIVGRALSASAGVLTVGAIYLAAKELFGRRVALASSAVFAVTFLNVRNSHFATNDVTAGLLMAITLIFCARVATRGTTAAYLLAGLFGGLATSTKYTSVVFFATLIVAHLYNVVSVRHLDWRTNVWKLAAPVLVALLAFVAVSPYIVLAPNEFLRDAQKQLELGREQAYGQFHLPTWLLILSTYLNGFGLIPTLLAIVGFCALVRRHWLLGLAIGMVPVLFILSLSQQQYFFARFVLPSLPAVTILTGYGLTRVSAKWTQTETRSWLFPALLAVTLAQGMITSTQFGLLINTKDTRTEAAEWIEANTPPEATIATEVHALMDNPWGWGPNSTSLRGPYWARDIHVFWPERDEEFTSATGGTYDFVIVTSWGYSLLQSDSSLRARYEDYENLPNQLTLQAAFTPGPNESNVDFAVDDMYSPFYHLFDRARPGPTVFIYAASPQQRLSQQ